MNEEDFQNTCRHWQKKLNLLNWDINFSQEDDLKIFDDTTDCTGFNCYTYNHNKSNVYIRSQKWRDENKCSQPQEYTIVHELLHLTFAPFTYTLSSGSIAQTSEEQAINCLCRAILGYSGAWGEDE